MYSRACFPCCCTTQWRGYQCTALEQILFFFLLKLLLNSQDSTWPCKMYSRQETPSCKGTLQVRLTTVQLQFQAQIHAPSNLEAVPIHHQVLKNRYLNFADSSSRKRWQCSRKIYQQCKWIRNRFLHWYRDKFPIGITTHSKKEQNQRKKKKNTPKHSQMLQRCSERGKPVEFKWFSEATSAYKKTNVCQCLTGV